MMGIGSVLGTVLLLVSSGQLAPAAETPKQVLAFYYGWYGTPEVSKQWVHWKDVHPENKTISNSTHYPALGAYDTHDPDLVHQHCVQARDAGITGFIATWWGRTSFSDEGMNVLLENAAKTGLKIAAYHETVPPRGSPNLDEAVKDFDYLIENYARHPAWLKAGGKPVFFVYGRAVREIGLDGWKQVVSAVRQQHSGGAVFIGDQISAESAKVFDGVHTYNITGRIKGMAPPAIRAWAKENFAAWVRTAAGGISCLTIVPGYDDTKLDRDAPRPTTHRHNGATYEILWEEAIAASPDYVLITSWNEWHEGSEIEPSVENGDPALQATKRWTPGFLKGKPGIGR